MSLLLLPPALLLQLSRLLLLLTISSSSSFSTTFFWSVVRFLEVLQHCIVPQLYDNLVKFIAADGFTIAAIGIDTVTRLSHRLRNKPVSRHTFCIDTGMIVVPNNRVMNVDMSGGPNVGICG